MEVASLDANDELDADAERHQAPPINGGIGHARPVTEVQHAHTSISCRLCMLHRIPLFAQYI